MIRGITLLIEEPSGNYLIDGPFLERLYAVMAQRARTAPVETLLIMAETPFPLEGMIIGQPSAASAALSSDRSLAVELVKDSDAVMAPPARIIYRLIASDPELAAELVAALDSGGGGRLVAESLAYFAYDKARSEKFPQLPISVSQDGAFLESLPGTPRARMAAIAARRRRGAIPAKSSNRGGRAKLPGSIPRDSGSRRRNAGGKRWRPPHGGHPKRVQSSIKEIAASIRRNPLDPTLPLLLKVRPNRWGRHAAMSSANCLRRVLSTPDVSDLLERLLPGVSMPCRTVRH